LVYNNIKKPHLDYLLKVNWDEVQDSSVILTKDINQYYHWEYFDQKEFVLFFEGICYMQ